MLSEPFLFALLRIFALSYPISSHHHTLQTSIDHDLDPQISSSLSIIHLELSSLNSLRQTDRILDKQLLNFALIALGSQDNLEKLRVVGSQTKEESLAGFGQAFTETFQSIDNANHPGRPAPSNSTLRATHSPQTVNRTKFNDPSVSRTREEERGQDRIDEISRSIAALKREQAELKRERQDRAGTMSSKRKVESLMDDTNSALVGGERDESFDAESQEDDEDIKSEQERARETTFGTDENGGNEVRLPSLSILRVMLTIHFSSTAAFESTHRDRRDSRPFPHSLSEAETNSTLNRFCEGVGNRLIESQTLAFSLPTRSCSLLCLYGYLVSRKRGRKSRESKSMRAKNSRS